MVASERDTDTNASPIQTLLFLALRNMTSTRMSRLNVMSAAKIKCIAWVHAHESWRIETPFHCQSVIADTGFVL